MATDLGYFSHFPMLATAIAITDGPVLELGSGWGSSPLVHYAAVGRFRVTADTDLEWLKAFSVPYACPRNHEFVHVKDEQGGSDVTSLMKAWVSFGESWFKTTKWAVAFVDCAPGEVRVPLIKMLKGKAGIIIAHDTEADEPGGGGNYRWRDLKGLFKYEHVMKRMRPWTTVYSDEPFFPVLEAEDAR